MPDYLIKPSVLGTGPATDCFVMIDAELPATSPTLAGGTDYEAFELSVAHAFTTETVLEAPTAFALDDINAVEGGQPVVVDLALAFQGTELSYSTDAPWATVTGTSLIIESAIRDATLTITASNAAGTASLQISVVITAAPSVPARFEDADWSLSDPQTGTDAVLSILALPASDTALNDIEYRIDGGAWMSLGVAITGDYTISDLVADTDLDFEIRALNATGPAPVSLAKEIILNLQSLSIQEGTSLDEVTFNAATGLYEVEVFAPASFAGQYSFDVADLNAGPVNLVPPSVTGTAEAGATVAAGHSLWVAARTDGPIVMTQDWLVGGVSQSTQPSYALSAEDLSAGVVLRVTATAGSNASSVMLAVAGEQPALAPDPVITGSLQIGQTLTMVSGDLTAVDYEYRWSLDGAVVTGATGATFSLLETHLGAVVSGESRALYSDGTWTDWRAATGGGTIAIASSFTEQGVVTGNDSYLQLRNTDGSDAPLSANTPHFMAFVSVRPDAIARQTILSWQNTNGRIDLWNGSGTYLRASLRASGTNNANLGSGGYTSGERLSMLLASYPNGSDLDIVGYVWRESEADWVQTITQTVSGASTVDFSSPLSVLAHADGSNIFAGTLYRIAAWAGAAMPDITQASTRANFLTSATQLADPALSQTAYGPALIDLYGTASDWTAATHNGALSGLVKFGGDFTNVD